MQRVFTRAVGVRWQRGDIRDYPTATWTGLAKSSDCSVDDFSEPVEEMASNESRLALHQRVLDLETQLEEVTAEMLKLKAPRKQSKVKSNGT